MRIFDHIKLGLTEEEKKLLALSRSRLTRAGRDRITVRELAEGYLTLADLKKVTREANGYHLRFLVGLFGDRLARCVGLSEMVAFREIQRGRGVSPSTIARRVTVYKAVINWGVRTKRLSVSPLTDLRIPAVRSRRPAPPTIDELNAMLPVAPSHVQRVIILGLYTGARTGPSELFKLRWDFFDFKSRTIWIPNAHKGAESEGRFIPMRDDIVPRMLQWREQDGLCPWVIHYHGRPVQSIYTAWKHTLKKAEIKRDITRYSLRHAHATFDIRKGAQIAVVADILGHKSIVQVQSTYYHIADTEKWEVIQSLPSLTLP